MDGYTVANREYFDQAANAYDDRPASVELARRTARAMRKAYPFDEDVTEVMDFACGTGHLSRELSPYVKSIVGVDISQTMVDRYNERVENQGIPPEEMRAVCAHLKGQEDELDGQRFDVIVCASAYHHFESIEDITRTLAYFLKPGGRLLVVDILKTGDHIAESIFPEHGSMIVAHRGGFREEHVRRAFEGAGLTNVRIDVAVSVKKRDQDVKLFLANGERNK